MDEPDIAAVYTAPMRCAVQTADSIARTLGVPLLPEPIREPGHDLDALTDHHHDGTVVLVTHQDAIHAARARLDPTTTSTATSHSAVAPCSVTEWRRRDGHWTCVRHNDIEHAVLDEEPTTAGSEARSRPWRYR